MDHPAVIRSVAAEHGVPLVGHNGKKDNTHTPVHGATVYAGLVRHALVAQHLVSKGLVRVG